MRDDDQPTPTALGPTDPLFPFGSPFGASTALPDEGVGTLPAEQAAPEAGLETELTMWAVVFAGGIGSRFWPLSTPERPKQLLALVGERPLIADTVARLAPVIPPHRVLVLTSADIADALHAAIPGVPRANMLVEPRPMGTAAALAWGAQEVVRRVGPKTVALLYHHLGIRTLEELEAAARDGRLRQLKGMRGSKRGIWRAAPQRSSSRRCPTRSAA